MCEYCVGCPVFPVCLVVYIQKMALEDDMPLILTLPPFQVVLSTKWNDVLSLPWRPIEALPMSHWFTFYDESKTRTLKTGGTRPDTTTAFMGILGLVLKKKLFHLFLLQVIC